MKLTLTDSQKLKLARGLFAAAGALCAFVVAQPDGVLPEWAKLAAGGCAAVLAALSPEILGAKLGPSA